MYLVKTLSVNYTTYNVCCDRDMINPGNHDFMMVWLLEDGPDVHPYWYAQVLGVYHTFMSTTQPTTHYQSMQQMEFLSLGARALGNRWEHVGNIEGRGSIYLLHDHQLQVSNISHVLPNVPDFISDQQPIITFPSQLKCSHHVSPHSMWVTSLFVIL